MNNPRNHRYANTREFVLTRTKIGLLGLVGLVTGICLFSGGIYYGRAMMEREIPELAALPEARSDLPQIEYTFAENLSVPKFVQAKPVPFTPISVEPVGNVAESTPRDTLETGKGGYAVQVAALQSREEGAKLITDLRGKGDPAYFGPTHFGSKGKWYRIWVGDYEEKEKAQEVAARFSKHLRSSAFVVSHRPSQSEAEMLSKGPAGVGNALSTTAEPLEEGGEGESLEN